MILEDSTEVRRGIHMNRWRVGEDMGRKEMDRCPLTLNAIELLRVAHGASRPLEDTIEWLLPH
jgi:hypothetical protein